MRPLDEAEKHSLCVTGELNEADPIWGEFAYVYESGGEWIVFGERCGSFICPPTLRGAVQNWSPLKKAKLTTWIVDQNRMANSYPSVTEDVLTGIDAQRPLRFSAKVERFFMYLNQTGYRIGDKILPGNSQKVKNEVSTWIEATDSQELWGFMQAMEAAGYVSRSTGSWLPTGEGLLRLENLDSQGAANDQAFVAMWFAPEMSEPYEKGIAAGLSDAGYRSFRIDQKEHSNKIDDEIIAEIRRSRFLVADFTSGVIAKDGEQMQVARGGVYYEAGFAQGLNMPVIWSVREDQIGMVHFDTRQFNHIVWTDAEDLRVKLYRRVAAVLGHFHSN